MIIYSATRAQFTRDVFANIIEERVLAELRQRAGHRVARAEVESWKNSLQYMNNALLGADIPEDAGVAIEYRIPLTSKRVDFILSGEDDDRNETVVIVELKQWTEALATPKDAIVEAFVGGARRELLHPSYQAWTYASLIQDFNETVHQGQINLKPCAYLHNCTSDDVIGHEHYRQHTDLAPAFLKKDTERLQAFLKKYIRHGDRSKTLYRIDHGNLGENQVKEIIEAAKCSVFFIDEDQRVTLKRQLTTS